MTTASGWEVQYQMRAGMSDDGPKFLTLKAGPYAEHDSAFDKAMRVKADGGNAIRIVKITYNPHRMATNA